MLLLRPSSFEPGDDSRPQVCSSKPDFTEASRKPARGHALTGTGMCACQGVLGVFQKLIANKAHDHEGFFILNSLLEYLPMELYQQYLPTVRPAPFCFTPAC